MLLINSLKTLCFLFMIILCQGTQIRTTGFTIPDIEITPLVPKGMIISMMHIPEICMVTFHGNLNRAIAGSAPGEISMEATVPIGNKWQLTNYEIILKPGDIIHYWMFVQYKQLGYRKNSLYRLPVAAPPETTPIPALPPPPCNCNNNPLTDLNKKVLEDVNKIRNETLDEIFTLSEVIKAQTAMLSTMKQVITEFLRTNDYGLKLKLLGPPLPKTMSPLNAMNIFVAEKLNITMINRELITKASLVDDGIVFDVENEYDKALLLRSAKDKLLYSHYKIIDNTVQCQIDVRSSFNEQN